MDFYPTTVSKKASVNKTGRSSVPKYLPPFTQILGFLGITHIDLNSQSITVSVHGLLYLLGEVLGGVDVDEAWYLERYPDVHAAILSGDTPSAAKHFQIAGYREGRLPREMPFDADYYYSAYKDLANSFDASDTAALKRHFETSGYREGRAGVAEHFADAERWRIASSGRHGTL